MTEFRSVQGDDPGWPFNRLVKACLDRGRPLDAHRGSLNGAVQAAKCPCPCGQHATPGRDFAFAEYPNGRVRVWSFTGCDTRICLEAEGLAHTDLQTGPDGQILPADDVDPGAAHLGAVPEYPAAILDGPLADLVEAGTSGGLPAPLMAGAGLGVLAALSGQAELRVWDTWEERAALWVPLIGPPGAGKTPALNLARHRARQLDQEEHATLREELAAWRETPRRERGERPADPTRFIKDITIEMVARWLDRGDGTGGIDVDELADFLRSMSRYRKGAGSDVGKWLELWSTQPWRYQRVDGDLDLYIARPVLAVCGGIQPEYLSLLGREGDGMRPRWLPHLAPSHRVRGRQARIPEEWDTAVEKLYRAREPRVWELSGTARDTWQEAADRWHDEGDAAESPSVLYALAKADVQCARIALALAESLSPGSGGQVPASVVTAAAAVTDYVMDVWRSIPGGDVLSYSRRDDALYETVEKLAGWLEQRGGRATKREIRRAHPAGIRDSTKLEEVLSSYESVYPGSVRAETPEDRKGGPRGGEGPYGTLIFAPRRGNRASLAESPEGGSGVRGQLSPATVDPETLTGDSGGKTPGREDQPPTVARNSAATVGSATVGSATVGAAAGEQNVTVTREAFRPGGVTVIRSPGDLEAVLPLLLAAPVVGLDIETTGLDPMTSDIRLIQLATPGGAYVIDCYAVPGAVAALQQVAGSAPALVVHDGQFDLRHLIRAGLDIPAGMGSRLRDTALASRLLTAGDVTLRSSLDAAAGRYLGVTLDKTLQASDWSGELSEDQVRYAAADAAVLLPLRDAIGAGIRRAGLSRVAAIENRCLPAMAWLMDSGAPFDAAAHSAASVLVDEEAAGLLALLEREAPRGFRPQGALDGLDGAVNFRSPRQLLEMFASIGVKLPDTSESTLRKVDHPLARILLRYRSAAKLQSTYGRPLADAVAADGRIHATFRQIGSDAGRMSCTGPNLQQVPRANGFRRLFRAPDGRVLIKADYSQIELRIAAEISGDTEMTGAFARGDDLHAITAQKVLGKRRVSKAARQAAKALNFGLIYGMGAERLREHARDNYGVEMTLEEAAGYRDQFFRAYKGLRRWHRSQPAGPVDTRTMAGRRRMNITRFTEKLNSPVQGSGADGLKLALALLHERKDQAPAGTFPVLTVHDEIVIECPSGVAGQARDWLVTAMQDGMQEILQEIPAVADATVADTWEGE